MTNYAWSTRYFKKIFVLAFCEENLLAYQKWKATVVDEASWTFAVRVECCLAACCICRTIIFCEKCYAIFVRVTWQDVSNENKIIDLCKFIGRVVVKILNFFVILILFIVYHIRDAIKVVTQELCRELLCSVIKTRTQESKDKSIHLQYAYAFTFSLWHWIVQVSHLIFSVSKISKTCQHVMIHFVIHPRQGSIVLPPKSYPIHITFPSFFFLFVFIRFTFHIAKTNKQL